MRPILNPPAKPVPPPPGHDPPSPYAAETRLAKTVMVRERVGPTGSGGAPQYRQRQSSVGALAQELEALYVKYRREAPGRWIIPEVLMDDSLQGTGAAQPAPLDVDARVKELLKQIGKGYEEATASLINDTGPYCAYCEAADRSGLRADPLVPVSIFPTRAFRRENLLLACEKCRSRKQEFFDRELEKIVDASVTEGMQALENRLAWPHRYHAQHEFCPYPFVYRAERAERIDFANAALVDDEDTALLAAFRRGHFGVVREPSKTPSPRLVIYLRKGSFEEGEAGNEDFAVDYDGVESRFEPVYLRVQVEPDDDHDPDLIAKVSATIDALDLNCNRDDPFDRRQELRAKAWFTARDCADRLGAAMKSGSKRALAQNSRGLLQRTMSATGFWSLWEILLQDSDPEVLASFPGTFTGWFE